MSEIEQIKHLYLDRIGNTLDSLVITIHFGFRRRTERVIELLETCKSEMDTIIANRLENEENFVRNSLIICLRDAIVYAIERRDSNRNELFTIAEQTFYKLFKFNLNLPVRPLPQHQGPLDRHENGPLDRHDPSATRHAPGPGTRAYDPSGVPSGGTGTEFSDMYTVLNNLHMRLSALESIKVNLLRN